MHDWFVASYNVAAFQALTVKSLIPLKRLAYILPLR